MMEDDEARMRAALGAPDAATIAARKREARNRYGRPLPQSVTASRSDLRNEWGNTSTFFSVIEAMPDGHQVNVLFTRDTKQARAVLDVYASLGIPIHVRSG